MTAKDILANITVIPAIVTNPDNVEFDDNDPRQYDNLVLTGAAETDYLTGRKGNDILIGGSGYDVFFGGDGDDFLFGDTAMILIFLAPDTEWMKLPNMNF